MRNLELTQLRKNCTRPLNHENIGRPCKSAGKRTSKINKETTTFILEIKLGSTYLHAAPGHAACTQDILCALRHRFYSSTSASSRVP